MIKFVITFELGKEAEMFPLNEKNFEKWQSYDLNSQKYIANQLIQMADKFSRIIGNEMPRYAGIPDTLELPIEQDTPTIPLFTNIKIEDLSGLPKEDNDDAICT